MKQKNIFKKLLTLVLLLVGSATGAWADETSTLTFTAACGGSGTANDGAKWTVTSDASESTYDGTKGIHYGTGKVEVSYLNLSTSDISGTITSIVVNASGASSTAAVLNVTVGGSAFGTGKDLTSSAANYTFSGSASGEIVVSLTQESAKRALYVKSITVTYSTGGDPTAPSATLDKTSLDFGKVNFGETKSMTFTVTPANLTGDLAISCNNEKYEVTPKAIAQATTTAQAITVTAKPTALNDDMNGTITISGGGLASSKTVILSTTVTDPNASGSQTNPYTVAEARDAIDAGTGTTGVYATGIVSEIVTAYSSQHGNITYNISADGKTTSDQLQAYRGKSYNGDNFTSENDIQVGDIVVVYGNLKKYNSTYEFDQNNQLVSLVRPVIPTHTATFSVNGVTTSDDYQEGKDIVFPADPNDMCGKVFMGWAANAIDGTTDVAPSFVTKATMGTADVTFYAVFAKRTPSESVTKTDVLTNATTGVGDVNTYTPWSGKTATSDAIYAGNSAGNNLTIQLRTKYSNSGIVTTASGGSRIQKVTVDWYSETAENRTLDIYGKNTAYEAATDLYDIATQGTKLGSIVCGTSTKLTVTGDYTYIGIRSKADALYLNSISIDWETGTPATYSAYCTTVPAVIDVTAAGWATTTTPNFPVSFDANAEVYIATTVDANITLEKITEAPANTPIVVNAPSGSYTMTQIASASTITNNQLKSKAADDITAVDGDYVLGTWIDGGNTVVGFGKLNAAGVANMTDDKAFIPATALANTVDFLPFVIGDEESETTSINSIENGESRIENYDYFNLSGQRVGKDYKGIVVVNGKKVIRK